MPEIDNLLQEWPQEVEDRLAQMGLPTAGLQCDLSTYVDVVCGKHRFQKNLMPPPSLPIRVCVVSEGSQSETSLSLLCGSYLVLAPNFHCYVQVCWISPSMSPASNRCTFCFLYMLLLRMPSIFMIQTAIKLKMEYWINLQASQSVLRQGNFRKRHFLLFDLTFPTGAERGTGHLNKVNSS